MTGFKYFLIRLLGILIIWVLLILNFVAFCLTTVILSACIKLVVLFGATILLAIVDTKVCAAVKKLYQKNGLQTTTLSHSIIVEPILIFAVFLLMYVNDPTLKQVEDFYGDMQFTVKQAQDFEAYRFLPSPVKVYLYDVTYVNKYYETHDPKTADLTFTSIAGDYSYPLHIWLEILAWFLPALVVSKRFMLITSKENT